MLPTIIRTPLKKRVRLSFKKIICSLTAFLIAAASLGIPLTASASSRVPYTPNLLYNPPLLRGLRFGQNNPLQVSFILDEGNMPLSAHALDAESHKLIRYFLAALAMPENELWVNLSPYEHNKIMPDALAQTDMGEAMLSQDYLLKQLAASLSNPDSALGKQFWQKAFQRSQQLFGTTAIPLDTFNKVWITPDTATVYESRGKAFIGEAKLKVMMEEDYRAARQQENLSQGHKVIRPHAAKTGDATRNATSNTITTQIMREVILPVIEKEINTGAQFTQLRQMYHALILASWFKRTLQVSLTNPEKTSPRAGAEKNQRASASLSTVFRGFIDKKNIRGIDTAPPGIREKMYHQYLAAYTKGAYDYIKKEYEVSTKKHIRRRYFSGGIHWKARIICAPARALTKNTIGSSPMRELGVRFSPRAADIQKTITPTPPTQLTASPISPSDKAVLVHAYSLGLKDVTRAEADAIIIWGASGFDGTELVQTLSEESPEVFQAFQWTATREKTTIETTNGHNASTLDTKAKNIVSHADFESMKEAGIFDIAFNAHECQYGLKKTQTEPFLKKENRKIFLFEVSTANGVSAIQKSYPRAKIIRIRPPSRMKPEKIKTIMHKNLSTRGFEESVIQKRLDEGMANFTAMLTVDLTALPGLDALKNALGKNNFSIRPYLKKYNPNDTTGNDPAWNAALREEIKKHFFSETAGNDNEIAAISKDIKAILKDKNSPYRYVFENNPLQKSKRAGKNIFKRYIMRTVMENEIHDENPLWFYAALKLYAEDCRHDTAHGTPDQFAQDFGEMVAHILYNSPSTSMTEGNLLRRLVALEIVGSLLEDSSYAVQSNTFRSIIKHMVMFLQLPKKDPRGQLFLELFTFIFENRFTDAKNLGFRRLLMQELKAASLGEWQNLPSNTTKEDVQRVILEILRIIISDHDKALEKWQATFKHIFPASKDTGSLSKESRRELAFLTHPETASYYEQLARIERQAFLIARKPEAIGKKHLLQERIIAWHAHMPESGTRLINRIIAGIFAGKPKYGAAALYRAMKPWTALRFNNLIARYEKTDEEYIEQTCQAMDGFTHATRSPANGQAQLERALVAVLVHYGKIIDRENHLIVGPYVAKSLLERFTYPAGIDTEKLIQRVCAFLEAHEVLFGIEITGEESIQTAQTIFEKAHISFQDGIAFVLDIELAYTTALSGARAVNALAEIQKYQAFVAAAQTYADYSPQQIIEYRLRRIILGESADDMRAAFPPVVTEDLTRIAELDGDSARAFDNFLLTVRTHYAYSILSDHASRVEPQYQVKILFLISELWRVLGTRITNISFINSTNKNVLIQLLKDTTINDIHNLVEAINQQPPDTIDRNRILLNTHILVTLSSYPGNPHEAIMNITLSNTAYPERDKLPSIDKKSSAAHTALPPAPGHTSSPLTSDLSTIEKLVNTLLDDRRPQNAALIKTYIRQLQSDVTTLEALIGKKGENAYKQYNTIYWKTRTYLKILTLLDDGHLLTQKNHEAMFFAQGALKKLSPANTGGTVMLAIAVNRYPELKSEALPGLIILDYNHIQSHDVAVKECIIAHELGHIQNKHHLKLLWFASRHGFPDAENQNLWDRFHKKLEEDATKKAVHLLYAAGVQHINVTYPETIEYVQEISTRRALQHLNILLDRKKITQKTYVQQTKKTQNYRGPTHPTIKAIKKIVSQELEKLRAAKTPLRISSTASPISQQPPSPALAPSRKDDGFAARHKNGGIDFNPASLRMRVEKTSAPVSSAAVPTNVPDKTGKIFPASGIGISFYIAFSRRIPSTEHILALMR